MTRPADLGPPSLRSAHPNRVRGGALEDEPAASRPFCLFGQASRRQASFPQTLHEMFEIIRCRMDSRFSAKRVPSMDVFASATRTVGGGANPRINGGAFVTVHVALWSGIIRTSGTASWSPIVTGRLAPCKRWPSATASGG